MSRSHYIDTAAVLIVAQIRPSAEWYQNGLGFDIGNPDWAQNPKFIIAQNEGAAVMLREGKISRPPNRELVGDPPIWDVYIWVRDIEEIENQLKARKTPIHSGPERMPHGCTELTVLDPDGYKICFGYCP